MAITQTSPPGSQVNASNLVTATTGVVLWSLESFAFHGSVPPPVYAFVMLGVPMLCGRLSAELAYRRALRRAECPKGL